MSDLKQNSTEALPDSESDASTERRRERRWYLKVQVEVRVESGATFSGLSRDLSPSTMGVVVSTPLAIGQEVWLTFDFPVAQGNVREIVIQASVRQRVGFRYGFEFAAPLPI